MTDLDHSLDLRDLDAPTSDPSKAHSSEPGRRTGVWRVVSFGAVLAAMIITALSVIQSRSAGDVPVPEQAAIALQATTVTIADLPTPEGSHLAVLGLSDAESRRPVEAGGTEIALPRDLAALVALTSGNGDLTGLAVVPDGGARLTTELSPRSTARALVVLSPGVLRPNLARALESSTNIENDPAFERLVDAIRTNPDISNDNPPVEQAFAEIADRIVPGSEADQGCDSVVSGDAYPSAGTCVQPRPAGLVIENEQDRWVLVYSADDDGNLPCAAVGPVRSSAHDPLIPNEQCAGDSLLAAPGPVLNRGEGQQLVDKRVRAAAAVTALHEYAGPFADLAGASAGFARDSVDHILRDTDEIVGSLTLLIETDDEFAAATDVARRATTPLDRHVAAVAAARLIIDTADTTAIIPQRVQGERGHTAILDFYTRVGERMISNQTTWRWEADGAGSADFGVGDR